MKILTLLFIAILFLHFSLTSIAQISEYKLVPSDGASFDVFGAVSISGDYAVVGAPGDNEDSGSVYIFRRNGAMWEEENKIKASDGDSDDGFGGSVSISGDYMIVSATGDDDNGPESGSAYVFRRDGINWIEEKKLTASDGTAGEQFGSSVSISEDYAIVGASADDGKGAAYIFRRDGSNWGDEQKLTASDGAYSDYFGFSVSISGDYTIVGAWQNGSNDEGAAYIFRKTGSNWGDEQKLTASDGEGYDNFGFSVSISGDFAIIGAIGGNHNIDPSGAVYIFRRDGLFWMEEEKLSASDASQYDTFGHSVSISGDYAVIGQPGQTGLGFTGSAYIIKRNGTDWTEIQKITASDGAIDDLFGYSVSLSGDYTIVGSPQDDASGPYSGSAYVYSGFVVGVENEQLEYPHYYRLTQNFPNPFNPSTKIKFTIPHLGAYRNTPIQLIVYDVLGNEIVTLVNKEKPAGNYEVEFDGTGLPSGVYFYRLQAGNFIKTKKMLLMK